MIIPFWKPLEKFLLKSQRPDGAWAPLWFGNQYAADELNLTYGTSRVMSAIAYSNDKALKAARKRGASCLARMQNADGGWGGAADTPSSIEETALALEALAAISSKYDDEHRASIARGVDWLIEHTQRGTEFEPAPIGFYFAKLWYYEKLYPIIFTVAALQRVKALLDQIDGAKSPADDHPA